jgi:hypothetical protein
MGPFSHQLELASHTLELHLVWPTHCRDACTFCPHWGDGAAAICVESDTRPLHLGLHLVPALMDLSAPYLLFIAYEGVGGMEV